MSEPLSLDTSKTALLLMDYQRFVLDNFLPEQAARDAVSHAARLLAAARSAGLPVIHVTVGFRPGYPEISPRNRLFSRLRDTGLAAPGSEPAKIHEALQPRETEPVVVKHRVGAFTATDLERLLRAQGIETLVMAGVTTSGVVLSTLRQAFDLDYELFVVEDACADAETDVHGVLLEKVIPPHAIVISTEQVERSLQSAPGL